MDILAVHVGSNSDFSKIGYFQSNLYVRCYMPFNLAPLRRFGGPTLWAVIPVPTEFEIWFPSPSLRAGLGYFLRLDV